MKLKFFFTTMLLLGSFVFYAQGEKPKEKREQIKALKVAFLTTELDLTSKEAEKFWPIYNSFENKQFELRHQKMKGSLKKMDDISFDNMTEKDANALLKKMEEAEEELFLLRKKFISNLKGILPAVKIIKLKKAEEEFNRKLLKQYRSKSSNK